VAADPVGDGTLATLPAFTVVQELFLTETAKAADVVLPAAAWAEREGTYTNGERRVQRFYPATPAKAKADFQIAAEVGARVGVSVPKFASLVFAEIAKTIPAYAGLSYQALAQVEKQSPDVGGVDLYYGGTSYENKEGLGVQLASGAERGEAVAMGKVELPQVLGEGLMLVPTTVLYDKGTVFAEAALMHPRVPAAHAELHAADAARLGIAEGDRVTLTASGQTWTTQAHVNGRAPEGAVLLPESLGVKVPARAVSITVSK
jgi:NADH-quinone oxidoreductase subunit G